MVSPFAFNFNLRSVACANLQFQLLHLKHDTLLFSFVVNCIFRPYRWGKVWPSATPWTLPCCNEGYSYVQEYKLTVFCAPGMRP
jgi:hypothetical protein